MEGLLSARACERPSSIPVGRPRGAKALGVRYERALARSLPGATHGQWWEFFDANGRGFCQTDFFLPVGEVIVVLESKYTWTPLGHSQLERLYLPVLRLALRREVLGIVVCKKLVPEVMSQAMVCGTLAEACEASRGTRAVWHVVDPKPRRRGTATRPASIPAFGGVP